MKFDTPCSPRVSRRSRLQEKSPTVLITAGSALFVTVNPVRAVCSIISCSRIVDMLLTCRSIVILGFRFWTEAVVLFRVLWGGQMSFYVLVSSLAITTFWAAFQQLSAGWFDSPRIWTARPWFSNVVKCLCNIDYFLLCKDGAVLPIFHRYIHFTPHKSHNRRDEQAGGYQPLREPLSSCIIVKNFYILVIGSCLTQFHLITRLTLHVSLYISTVVEDCKNNC